MKNNAIPRTNSGVIFGPPTSVSKNLIRPIAELGPAPPVFFCFSNFIFVSLKY